MRWIGLKANDVISQENLAHDSYIPLTMRDRAVAVSMLASEEWRDQSGVVLPGMGETLVELRRMLMLNRKAEIQILDDREGGLDGWLTKRLRK
jgi:meiotic recombination protein SPO11